ncbi:hypothetical protein PRZ48_009123 [Zasmidium cellare]|uniref:Uncharacterized protein n=1 Tax=Zasmidium cellare TaxID=395010 RepID=A0ABR0EI63_ZASCE|nr:hypothetical protein PRZ48_009123 [Zasmidium cellare]
MFSKYASLFSSLILPTLVAADGAFHTASYYVSYVTQFKGTLIVPPRVPSGGTPYVWPGLQPPDNSGNPVGSGDWTITSTSASGQSVSYDFGIQKRLNQALFAVELYDNSWDFGNVVFQDVEVVAETTETSWCTANPQYSDVTIDFEGVSSSQSGGFVTCSIQQVTLSPP